jgi:hypothetical protein
MLQARAEGGTQLQMIISALIAKAQDGDHLCAKVLFERAEGAPLQAIEHSVPVTAENPLAGMTPDERRQVRAAVVARICTGSGPDDDI